MGYFNQFKALFLDKKKFSPLSSGQYDIWLEQQLYPHDISNHSHFVAKISEELDVDTLKKAFLDLCERHECTRTIFPSIEEIPVRNILPTSKVSLQFEDCSFLSEDEIKTRIKTKFEIPFDLSVEAPYRFFLYKQSSAKYYLQIVGHHIAVTMDAYVNLPIELAKLYTSIRDRKSSNLSSQLSTYSHFVEKQYEELNGNRYQIDKSYWMNYLSGDLPEPLFPIQLKTPSFGDFLCKTYQYDLDPLLITKIKEISKSSSVSDFTFLTSTFQALLHLYTNQEEAIIGIANDTRRGIHREVLGYTANSLPLRSKFLSEEEFTVFLKKNSRDIQNMIRHRLYPLMMIMDDLREQKGNTFSELFKILIISQKSEKFPELASFGIGKEGSTINVDGLTYESTDIGLMSTGRFDLALAIVETEHGYSIVFHYNGSVIQESVIQELGRYYLELLQKIADNPHQKMKHLSLVSQQEQYLQLNNWNQTSYNFKKEGSFIDWFEKQVCLNPKNTALIYNENKVDYETLNHLANRVACHLLTLGANSTSPIGIALERSIDLVACLLGIMKAGCTYLPLDPEFPKERLQFMLEDSETKILLTKRSYQEVFDGFQGKKILIDQNLNEISHKETIKRSLSPEHLAYVIYTSGSTGKPKGVEVFQTSLDNLLLSVQQQLNLSTQDRWLALTTISFDIANLEILLPLSLGATIVLANSNETKDPNLLIQLIKRNKITFSQATPATWQMLIDAKWEGDPNLTILCGGEALSPALAEKLVDCVQGLWNMYGPTETTIWSSMKRINRGEKKITIGRPIANTVFHILNKDRHLLPIGVQGELYIGGIGLARGYRNRPELNAECFIPSPFPDTFSNRLYKTGDLACYQPNGEIEYLGRLDHQVKVRGYRIELAEIENAIEKCEGIQHALVVATGQKPENKRLIAYFTGNAKTQEIKQTLSRYLPGYMIPSAYMQLEQFPLTPNGKIDRKALPPVQDLLNEAEYVAPRNEIEHAIAQIFEELLQVKKISIEADFFSLGGHSLLAAQAITKINQAFHIHLTLKILFEKSTISLIAQEVESAKKIETALSVIPRISENRVCGLSHSQQRFWFLHQQTGGGGAYNIPFVLEMNGDLDPISLQKALDEIVNRHESLRTVFKEGSEGPEQLVLAKTLTKIRYEDFSINEHPEKDSQFLIETEAKKAFDLSVGPLFNFVLVRLAEKKYILFLNFHHIILDGYSIHIFLYELKVLYESYSSTIPLFLNRPKIQYKDYVFWQQDHSQKGLEKQQRSWWIEKLNDAPTILNFPTDKFRPSVQTYNGSSLEFLIIDKEEKSKLTQFCNNNSCTPFMFLLSAFFILLHRYTAQNDLVIGVPISGRSHIDLQNLIGCFINTLPLRITSDTQNSFLGLLGIIRKECLLAFEHQDVPFEKIIEDLKIKRSPSHSPLVQVMFNMLPEIKISTLGNLELYLKNIDHQTAHLDLSLSIQETPEGLLGIFEYNIDLFLKPTIERLAQHFKTLITEILRDPQAKIGKLPILSSNEISQQTIEWNSQPVTYCKNKSFLEEISRWAKISPDAIAITCEGKNYSYSYINTEANKIAHSLLKLGIASENKVAVCLNRSAEFIPAILGILKAGGAYVPIDITQPTERLTAILRDLDPLCILTDSSLTKLFPNHNCLCIDQLSTSQTDNPSVYISPDQLAYIIYTSGSTGHPKGVEIEHKSLNDRIFWKDAAYPLNHQDVMLHTYSFIFDGAILNYFWPLCAGAHLVIATKEEQFDPSALIELILDHNVTTVDLLPSLLQGLLEENKITTCSSLKNVFSGGEALPGSILQLFYQKCPWVKLHNTYGPTEATVEASVWECEPNYIGPIAPIGKPIAGASLFILDENQNMLPVGVPGELYIGGIGLARGYLNDPSLTAKKFIQNPFSTNPQERLYRTGDLTKYNNNGNIEFLGRIDNQVKIRGYRIDLREIENALLNIDVVDKAIVKLEGDGLHKRLLAYVVLNDALATGESLLKSIKTELGKKLPTYMVPQHILVLDHFPTLPNGKINYKQLPTPDCQEHPESGRECKNELEQKVLSIWQEVLELPSINVTDNFFEIGGNSLLAMKLIARIKNELQLPIPLIQLFQYPTIESFSNSLSSQDMKKPWSPIVAMQSKGHKKPFFCIHPLGGGVLCYQALAKHWGTDRPFYAIQARGLQEGQLPHESIKSMAKEYIENIIKIQPSPPYFIGGWSYGGLIATEIASQLQKQGKQVSLLALIDTTANIEKFQHVDIEDESVLLSELTNHFAVKPPPKKSRLLFKEQLVRFIENGGKRALKKGQKSDIDLLVNLAKANHRALRGFSIPRLDIDVALIKSELSPEETQDLGWNKYTTRLKIFKGPGDHWAVTQNDPAAQYAKLLQKALDRSSEKLLD